MRQSEFTSCLREEELAQLLEDAFATWQAGAPDHCGQRQTPRVSAVETKPIYVDSYVHDGREIALNQRATVVDISADGLGIMLAGPLPTGALLRFAFATGAGGCGYGVASVVRVARHDDGFHIGLIFPERAETLDIGPDAGNETRGLHSDGQRRGFHQVIAAARVAYRMLVDRRSACRKLRRRVDGREALFRVEVRQFRYSATLYVGGRKVARRSGALKDRFRSLFYEEVIPTTIRLEGGGFSAWAVAQANNVRWCVLDLSLEAKRRLRLQGAECNYPLSTPPTA